MGSTQTLPGLPASAQKPPGITLRMLADAPPAPASFACVGHAAAPDGEQHSGCIPYPHPRFPRGAVISASEQHFGLGCLGKCRSGARSPPPFDFCRPSSSRRPRRAPASSQAGPGAAGGRRFAVLGFLPQAASCCGGCSGRQRLCCGVTPSLIRVLWHLTAPCVGAWSHSCSVFLLTGSGMGRVRLDQGLGWGVPAGVWHVWRQRCCSVQAFPTPPAPRPPARPCWRP